MLILHLKLEVSFWTYLKHLTMFGMYAYYINSNRMVINGPLLTLIKIFLTNRFQRVVLNGQTSKWKEVLAGVPKGSILGPLFFLVYINDLPDGIQSNVKIFADDTSIFSVMTDNIRDSATLNYDLNLVSK